MHSLGGDDLPGGTNEARVRSFVVYLLIIPNPAWKVNEFTPETRGGHAG